MNKLDKDIDSINPIYLIMATYKELKGYTKIPNWDKVFLKRYSRCAKELFQLSDYSIATAIKALKEITDKLNKSKLNYWDLNTVVREFPEWMLGKNIANPRADNLYSRTEKAQAKIAGFKRGDK